MVLLAFSTCVVELSAFSSSPTMAARLLKLNIGSRPAPPPGGVPEIKVSCVSAPLAMLTPLALGEASDDDCNPRSSFLKDPEADSLTDEAEEDTLDSVLR